MHQEFNDDPETTLSAPAVRRKLAGEACIGLTVLWHPERARVGEQAAITARIGAAFELNRHTPLFRRPMAATPRTSAMANAEPLAHRAISRQPLLLHLLADGGVRMQIPGGKMEVRVDGVLTQDTVLFDAARIAGGIVLQLGERVVLCLGLITVLPTVGNDHGLVGVSRAVESLRAQIRQVARSELSVLLLGESGSGKELVAQAVHRLSARHAGPMVSVNMAALNDALAAAELFGAHKGAYTGALQARRGLLAEASGGTLFMDEIGDTPASVQPMLLRALETGEYRPLGAPRAERSDVRFIAATDRNLASGGFNQPLLRRLEAFVIRLPPLRERRQDVGVLVRHFLDEAQGEDEGPVAFEAADIATLACFDWPGNVRQLAHVVRRLALARRSDAQASLDAILDALTTVVPSREAAESLSASAPMMVREPPQSFPPVPAGAPAARSYRDPNSIDDAALYAAFAASEWCVRHAAELLGISRTSCYALLERSQRVRRVEDIALAEIRAVMQQYPGDLQRWAAELRTPRESLRRHIKHHGLLRD